MYILEMNKYLKWITPSREREKSNPRNGEEKNKGAETDSTESRKMIGKRPCYFHQWK